MFDAIAPGTLGALVGLGGGLLLGLAARLGRFCTLGAIEDLLYQGSDLRIRMWVMAIGVAVLGSFGLMQAGVITGLDTPYLGLGFMPVAAVLGGLIFGYGMALAGNCGFGALARLGGGDLRNFVIVVVLGLSAYIALNGPLAEARVALFPPRPAAGTPPGLAHGLAAISGISAPLIGMVVGLALMAFSLTGRAYRADIKAIFWSIVVGLAIVSGWAGTAWAAHQTFGAVALNSHTFAAPVGDTMFWLMMASGVELNFAVGSVAGVLAGAFIGSLIKGHFRWEACEDPRELRRQIWGAALMGIGAVLAFGCTVGQGLSAFSLLAYSAPLTMAAIFAGAAIGLRQLISGFAIAR